MKLHLTDMSVRALKGSESNPKYFDIKTPGFGIRCGLKRKTWVVMRGKDRELVTIGRYPDLPLIDARKEAKKLLSTEPEKRQETCTFGAAKNIFLEENYKDRSIRAKSEATRLLNKHFKKLHATPLTDLDDTHISARLSKLAHTPSEQLHGYRTVRCFLTWCTRPPRRYLKHSPMEGYQPPGKDRKGTRTLTDAELKAVWKAAESPPYDVVRILILWAPATPKPPP